VACELLGIGRTDSVAPPNGQVALASKNQENIHAVKVRCRHIRRLVRALRAAMRLERVQSSQT
jgi:hypothetical protein